MTRLAIALVFILAASRVDAACTFSSPSSTTTGDSASVKSCLDQAIAAGGTQAVTITTSATWSGLNPVAVTVNTSVNLTIQGTGYSVDSDGRTTACNIVFSNGGLGDQQFLRITWTNTSGYVRITGLCWDAGDEATPTTYDLIDLIGGGSATALNYRVDHNYLYNMNRTRGVFVETSTSTNTLFGLTDYNTFNCKVPHGGTGGCQSVVFYPSNSAHATNDRYLNAESIGTGHTNFVENNTFAYEARNDGCVEAYSASFVMRFNIVHTCLQGSHGTDSSDVRGPWAIENYFNAFDLAGCLDSCTGIGQLQYRGGELAAFNNTWVSGYSQSIQVDNYRSISGYSFWDGWCSGTNPIDLNDERTSPGRHCMDQVGTLYNNITGDGSHTHNPAFFINNTKGGNYSYAERGNNPPSIADNPIFPNEDFFNGVNASNPDSCTTSAPIGNGTCGIGYGTFAQMPATCTGPDVHGTGGVLYWATDKGGDWNTVGGSANDGAVYRCSATNTWTLYYTPFCYPYTAYVGSVCGGAPAPSTGPTRVRRKP